MLVWLMMLIFGYLWCSYIGVGRLGMLRMILMLVVFILFIIVLKCLNLNLFLVGLK